MSELNDSQRRHVVVTFRCLDELMTTAARLLREGNPPSPFAQVRADATPAQARLVEASAAQLRDAMRRILERWNVQLPQPSTGAVWSARVNLSAALVDLADMRPRTLRGYGPVDEDLATQVREAAAELRSLIERVERYLAQGSAADLSARLAKIEGGGDALPVLRQLERVIDEHDLVELRPVLGRMLDSIESQALEIAFFGRVSSGKSSLLNRFLGGPVLPVGVTPVTAVPVRTRRGDREEAVVYFAGQQPRRVSLAALEDFASEEKNPGNEKLVTRIEVSLPAERLAPGVALVDTPGLGSLATSGAAATLAYLPRCDVGVVLVDAGATLSPDELHTIESLVAAGARPIVLISKADLLAAPDLARLVDYVKKAVRAQLGLDLSVVPVSVPGDATLAEQWFRDELVPLERSHASQRSAALGRKLVLLRDGVVAALEARLAQDGRAAVEPGIAAADAAAATEALGRGARRCEDAESRLRDIAHAIPGAGGGPLRRAVAALAAESPSIDGEAVTALVTEAADAMVDEHTAEAMAELDALRDDLGNLLSAAGAIGAIDNLPSAAGAPAFDAIATIGELAFASPPLAFLGRRYREQWLARELDRLALPRLARALEVHRRLFEDWGRRSVRELQRAFEAELALVSRSDLRDEQAGARFDRAAARRDLEEIRAIRIG